MKRRIRLVTLCGCERELYVPSIKLTVRVPLRRSFTVLPESGSPASIEMHTRNFEHHHGTGLGDDVAVFNEVMPR